MSKIPRNARPLRPRRHPGPGRKYPREAPAGDLRKRFRVRPQAHLSRQDWPAAAVSLCSSVRLRTHFRSHSRRWLAFRHGSRPMAFFIFSLGYAHHRVGGRARFQQNPFPQLEKAGLLQTGLTLTTTIMGLPTEEGEEIPVKPGNKSLHVKYSCMKCKINIWGKPGLNVVCGECDVRFQAMQS